MVNLLGFKLPADSFNSSLKDTLLTYRRRRTAAVFQFLIKGYTQAGRRAGSSHQPLSIPH